jgi:hypothetical protein
LPTPLNLLSITHPKCGTDESEFLLSLFETGQVLSTDVGDAECIGT